MTINLHETGNPINRHERNKINENWQRITEGLNKLQRQIYILAGSQEVDEILERIDKAITDANNATTEVNSKIDEATNLINQLVDLINESQLIINNGNQLINDGTQLINTLTSLKADLVQLKSQLEDIINKESERIDNENQRITNEQQREQNELIRQQNETNRETTFNTQMQQINDVLPHVLHLENVESWDSTKQYYKNNIVEYDGSSFMALKDNIGQQPPILPTKQNEHWSLLAQRGVDGQGAVSSVNGKSPNIDGNVELTAEDIGAIPVSEKGVVGGVARLNEDGKVVDANGNEVEGKVKSVNGKTGDVQITSGDIHNIDPLPVTAYATAYPTGHSVMFIPANNEYSVGWRESLGLDTSINWYLIVEYFKTTSNNGYQKVTAYRLGSNLPNVIFMRNSTGSTSFNNWKRIFTSDDITDSTTTDDSTKVASAKAVKTVNDNLTQLQQTVTSHLEDNLIHRRIYVGYDEPLDAQEGDIWLDLNPPRKILADWRMLETSGENVIDYSGNGYHGTIIGNVERVSPINEGSLSALKGDGETGYIQTPFNAIAGLDNFEVVAYVIINGIKPSSTTEPLGWHGIVNHYRTSGSPSEYKNIGYHVSYHEWLDSNKPNERKGWGFGVRMFAIDGETITTSGTNLYSNIYAEFGVPYKLTLDFDGKIGIATFKVEKVLSNGQLEHVWYGSSLVSGIMQFGTNPLNLMATNTDEVMEHGNVTLGRVTISTKMR